METDITYGAFVARMRELGHVDGESIVLDWRFAEGRYERLPGFAKELVDSGVDVILAMTPPSVQAAKAATRTIPIVMVAVGDPVALGFVPSFSRPGGNITGVSNAIDDVSRKYLELLREAVPGLSRVVALVNPDNPNVRNIYRQIEAAGRAMGIAVSAVEANTAPRIEQGFEAMRRAGTEAVIVQGDGFLFVQRALIAELALKNRLATMFWTPEAVRAGALMSYGQPVSEDYRKAANYVDRILKGAQPRDLPVDQPTEVQLTLNLRTAKALGLTIPRELLLRAGEVVE
ncbi:MAG TPA: ABC transporter substrate-binding protein [Burkholderiales bacterium]|nr:ABC transporter substrate-binding protein [Burkholderiales bacterium]